MAAKSKHPIDVLDWLYKVIDSCITPHQALSAQKLCRLYNKKYPYKVWGDKLYIEYQCLIDRCDRTWNKLIIKGINDFNNKN